MVFLENLNRLHDTFDILGNLFIFVGVGVAICQLYADLKKEGIKQHWISIVR
jgi:hypothetical protein